MPESSSEHLNPCGTGRLVVIVHLGREGGWGGLRRVDELRKLFEYSGASVFEISLRKDHAAPLRHLTFSRLCQVIKGEIVPEALSWSLRSVLNSLEDLKPDLIICETARAFAPDFQKVAPVTLDFVDRLSVSYLDRSKIVSSYWKRLGFQFLAWRMAKFESFELKGIRDRLAVGHSDAMSLNARWLPITTDEDVTTNRQNVEHDVIFFGNLSYPPNVEAVMRLARIWPNILDRRRETTLILAGASPTSDVEKAAARNGWLIERNPVDMAKVLARAAISVVPLEHASGMQIKVLDAAIASVPQVISTSAAAGYDNELPVVVVDDDKELVDEMVRLLSDSELSSCLADQCREHVLDRYGTARWSEFALGLIDGGMG